MRIGINTLPITPGKTGIGAFAEELAAATQLVDKHDFVYISGPNGCGVVPEEQVLRVEHPGAMWEQLHLPTELAENGVDLYHSPLFTCPIVQQVPSVITIHDVIPMVTPELCSDKFLEFFHSHIGPAYRTAHAVMTVSECSKRAIVEHLGVSPGRVHVVRQSIRKCFRPDARVGSGFRLPQKYILYVGMIDARKNVERLILAFGQVVRDLGDCHLIIAGRSDSEAHSLAPAIADSRAEGRVHMLGYVADEDLPGLYAGAQAFAFPSLQEGFGRPVIEAMASGTPVACSNTSSLPEAAGGAAVLFDPEDVDSISEALRAACKDSNQSELREKGLARARQFTRQAFAQDLSEFYTCMEGERCG